MFSWLKKYFIPHEKNGHRPHFLSDTTTKVVIAVVLLLEIVVYTVPTLTFVSLADPESSWRTLPAEVLPTVLSTLTNEERNARKLAPLAPNPVLDHAAQLKANDMALKGYFAHTSPEGKTPWYWMDQAGYDYVYAGENLAINFADSEDVAKAWMASPTHRANIEKGKYTEIGTAVATGMYEGRETVFVVQVYASPNKQPAALATVDQTPIAAPAVKPVAVAETPTPVVAEPTEVLGAETSPVVTVAPETVAPAEAPTFIEKAVASPRNTTKRILLVVFSIVLAALLLNTVIRIRHHHPDLVLNGLSVLLLIGAIFLTNDHFSKQHRVILDSVDYSQAETI